jgi:preprotein translocase subunit YajC
MINLDFILLMAPQEGQSPLTSFLPLILIVVVFYFFIIRPQMKKQKELKNFRSSLGKGDKVITTGGIFGKITDVKEDSLVIEIAEGIKIRVDKNSVVKDASDLVKKK